jgi:putative oxidoreductase
MNTLKNLTALTGRTLLVTIFLLAGLTKLSQYAGTQAYMASAGVPGGLLPLVIALEVGGSLAILTGLLTRPVAVLLAGFSLVSAALFHSNFQDQIQMLMFLKNVSMAGGFLFLALQGAGEWSVDAWLSRRPVSAASKLAHA